MVLQQSGESRFSSTGSVPEAEGISWPEQQQLAACPVSSGKSLTLVLLLDEQRCCFAEIPSVPAKSGSRSSKATVFLISVLIRSDKENVK